MNKRLLFVSLSLTCCLLSAFAGGVDTTYSQVIRSIRIEGNNVTQGNVILREMSLHTGDTLSQASLSRDRDRVYNLGLFNKVTVTHHDSAAVSDLVVTVVERWYIFPIPILNVRTRAVNTLTYGLGVMHENFLGRNEKVSASFSTGYDQSASLTYQNPRLTGDDDIFLRTVLQYRNSHSLDNNSDVVFQQINRLASFSIGKRFGYFQTLIGSAGYQTWQLPDTSLGRTVSPDGMDRFIELGLHYTFDARNVREYPTDGWYLDATATQDGVGSESTVKTFKIASDLRWYILMGQDITLACRSFGTVVTGGPVPMYHRLFLSSRLGVRGYNQRDYSGEDVVGGSAEARLPIIAPRFITFNFLNIYQFNTARFGIYAAFFTDVGKIWFRSNEFEEVPWLASAGAGLHFLLPYSLILRTEISVNAMGQLRVSANGGVPF
jgi:outer membrane protein assembly factor BamA